MLLCQTLLKNRTHPQEDRKEQKESIYTLVDMLMRRLISFHFYEKCENAE